MTKDVNSESEIKARTSKVRGAFAALKNIWKTNKISNRTMELIKTIIIDARGLSE